MKKFLCLLVFASCASLIGMESVTLESGDGQKFRVEVAVAKLSKTIKDVIETTGTDNPIPLDINGKILSKIISYLPTIEHMLHSLVKTQQTDAEVKRAVEPLALILQEETDEDLADITIAANYLDIPILLVTAIKECGRRICFYPNLEKLNTKISYEKYRQNFLIKFPKDLQKFIIDLGVQPFISIIEDPAKRRFFRGLLETLPEEVNFKLLDTVNRKLLDKVNLIQWNELDLTSALIIAYMTIHIEIQKLSDLPDYLQQDLNDYAREFLFPGSSSWVRRAWNWTKEKAKTYQNWIMGTAAVGGTAATGYILWKTSQQNPQ